MRYLPPKVYAHFLYEYYTGKKLNLDNPKEFNEKIQWLKVFYHPKILNQLVDKYAVREYVENKIGSEYLNELYAVYDSPDEVQFDKLPEQFVIKATHASSYNLIVDDKSKINIPKTKRLFKKWLSINQYYRTGQEWAYKDVQPRLIAEKFLKNEDENSLIDYKFYCFGGSAKFLEVHLDRAQNHKRGFYDLDFNRLPYRYVSLDKSISTEVKKPANFEEMINLSEILSDKFPFVRVDFYSIEGKAIFGEMTFYPSDGRKDFIPDEYNTIIGEYIKLPQVEKGQIVTEIA
ncbi:ATP-grasp fold amidoligase family protein [Mangrovimonas sp. YM274]|uniref:ATP-grasp fold amidoligase family protein n=1 Tax=Mangrovimonas sp. YM274 TaxID=3070660 RepID=UPI0027DD8DF3|nr:ATP-grasp fold amidoligase family protein [Mangrovimonas sp. YM274]WMI67836.1 ATP-grasp fold amidoligase family protein [Mangrovimonas sp. YM274]